MYHSNWMNHETPCLLKGNPIKSMCVLHDYISLKPLKNKRIVTFWVLTQLRSRSLGLSSPEIFTFVSNKLPNFNLKDSEAFLCYLSFLCTIRKLTETSLTTNLSTLFPGRFLLFVALQILKKNPRIRIELLFHLYFWSDDWLEVDFFTLPVDFLRCVFEWLQD